MVIKKFTGRTENEAVELAKKELGNGIVIMNVRIVKKKGISGWLGAKLTEVTVALEEEGDTLKSAHRETMTKTSSESVKSGEAGRMTHNTVNVMSESSQNIEKKLDSLQTLLVDRFKQQ